MILDSLFPGEIAMYLHSSNIHPSQRRVSPHLLCTLQNCLCRPRLSGNLAQRTWFRNLFERVEVPHELHFIDAPDDLCKRQLKNRSKDLPPGTSWTTDAEFEAITVYFQAPSNDEGFNVIRHERA